MTTRLGSRVLRTLVAALVCVLAGGEARAAPSAAPGFDQPLASSVFGTALRFMAPRILDPVSLRTLAGWGLGGITALDPSLQASVVGDRLVLSSAAGPVWRGPSPQDDDPAAWGEALAAITAAAWRVSSAVSGAGQVGVTQSFFDELFNHLDPYSRYVGPEPADADRDKREGSGGGIGVTLLRTSRGLALGDIAPDGPAADAGLATGARLLAIDGVDVGRADPDDALARLAGPVGSAVTIRIRLHGRTRDLTLQRDLVPPETVFGTSTDGLLTLKVTGFSRDTAEEMSALLDAALPDRPRGLIIDLRGNRGGLLQQAVTAAALVLDNGVATITEGRYPQSNHVWSVQGGDVTHGMPIVVLVDGRTASAAEILAAALADHRRAVVTGSVTLGKGLVQTLLQLPDGGELFVTWSRVLAPLGWPLQGLGVLPQLCTSGGGAAVADALHALETGTTTPLATALAAERASRPPLPVARILDLRSACPAAIGTDEDVDAAHALLGNQAAYAAALDEIPPLD